MFGRSNLSILNSFRSGINSLSFSVVRNELKNANASKSLISNTDGLDLDLLVQKAVSGSFEAFDQIMVHYRERLYGVIYNMTMNHSDAADLTQETFVKAFRSISKFKQKSSFFTWLYRIGVNLTLTFLKRKRSKKFF